MRWPVVLPVKSKFVPDPVSPVEDGGVAVDVDGNAGWLSHSRHGFRNRPVADLVKGLFLALASIIGREAWILFLSLGVHDIVGVDGSPVVVVLWELSLADLLLDTRRIKRLGKALRYLFVGFALADLESLGKNIGKLRKY